MVAGADLDAGEPVVGRGHRRLRRRPRGGRAAHDPRRCWCARSTAGSSRSEARCKQAADNTADTALIAETAAQVDAVLAEGLEHHLFLGRVLGKVRLMTTLVVLSVVDIVLLIAGLAFYLCVVGSQLTRIATNLEECADLVATIERNAEVIGPGVEHINHTGGVDRGRAAAAVRDGGGDRRRRHLPAAAASAEREPARPASGRRRSRLHDGVGYRPVAVTRPSDGHADPEPQVRGQEGSVPAPGRGQS